LIFDGVMKVRGLLVTDHGAGSDVMTVQLRHQIWRHVETRDAAAAAELLAPWCQPANHPKTIIHPTGLSLFYLLPSALRRSTHRLWCCSGTISCTTSANAVAHL